MKRICFFIMGCAGCGKDTQARNIAENLYLLLFSTSKYIRKEIEEGLKENPDDPILLREDKKFKDGIYNTFEWVLELVKRNIKQLADNNFDGHRGIVFAGSPRTLVEAEGLIPFSEDLFGAQNLKAIHIDTPEEVCIQRILLRSAKEPNKSRPFDMTRESIENVRLSEYRNLTMPVLEYFRAKNLLVKVDGNQSEDLVFAQILYVMKGGEL